MGANSKLKCFNLSLAVLIYVAFAQHAYGTEKTPFGNVTDRNLSEEIADDPNGVATNERRVIVYYFHGKSRCHTCNRIERLTKEAVKDFFADELRTGVIKLKVINVDEKENSHFSKDYKLFTKSVIVSDRVNGKEKRWKNLQKVWELIRDDQAFKNYIRTEVQAYLS